MPAINTINVTEAVKSSFESAKTVGTEFATVVDTASRTALSGAAAVNDSLVNYGRDLVNDTIEVSRKAFEVKSPKEFVELQTAYTERRIAAAFATMSALNSLAQSNVMAIWSPFAMFARTTGVTQADAAASLLAKSPFKTAA